MGDAGAAKGLTVRLLLHAGLHKTGSTYLQHVLVLNGEALRNRGVYVQPDVKLTANHGTAWMALRGDLRHLEAHVARAGAAGCHTMLLSSEDFEGLIFDPAAAGAVEAAARRAGAETVEWHFCLRDPGEYLLSMYAELVRHVLVDFTAMFGGAMRDGCYQQAREAGRLPAAWTFCFDPETHLTAFAAAIGGSVHVHDFRDGAPFPMHGFYAGLAGPDAPALPGQGSRNARRPESLTVQELAARLQAIVADSGLADDQVEALRAGLMVPQALREACATALSRRFAPGMERLLARGRVVAS